MPSGGRPTNHTCTVVTCPNPKDAKYHRFPMRNLKLIEEWITACKRSDLTPAEGMSNRVCDTHFSSDAYERDLQNELLGLPTKKRLKEDAVPTENLPVGSKFGRKSSFAKVDPKSKKLSGASGRAERYVLSINCTCASYEIN